MKHIQQVLVLAHGWGYNHRFFNPLLQTLQSEGTLENSLVVALECGYFPDQARAGVMLYTQDGWQHHPAETLHSLVLAHAEAPWIGVGHSLGTVRLLNTAVRWNCMVSINGFTRLAAMQAGQAGVAPRVLVRMLNKARSNMPKVLADFHHSCGHAPTWATLDDRALLTDLEWMLNVDIDPAVRRVVAIYSPSDAIVPKSLAESCFAQVALYTLITVDAPHGELGKNATRYTDVLLPVLRSD
ncbi:MAG TPA: hypothetical protein VFV43_05715 [Limnobacter sp.]|nr:hypothetical protein [Limnobacter sp.]